MQTLKATLLILICIALLCACGLSGPLYLPDENPASKPAVEKGSAAGTGGVENKEDDENDKKDPVSS